MTQEKMFKYWKEEIAEIPAISDGHYYDEATWVKFEDFLEWINIRQVTEEELNKNIEKVRKETKKLYFEDNKDINLMVDIIFGDSKSLKFAERIKYNFLRKLTHEERKNAINSLFHFFDNPNILFCTLTLNVDELYKSFVDLKKIGNEFINACLKCDQKQAKEKMNEYIELSNKIYR